MKVDFIKKTMTRIVLTFAFVLFYIPLSFAESSISDQEIARCAAVKGELARLDCFDRLAKEHNLFGKQTQQSNIKGNGQWLVKTEINPVDDSNTVTLYLEAESGKGILDDTVSLIVRCQSNKTDLHINWHSYLGNEARVLTRIGDATAQTSLWDISPDKEGSFRKAPIGFLKEMMKASRLVAQITPYNENPITAVFNTTGLSSAIKPLRETCSW